MAYERNEMENMAAHQRCFLANHGYVVKDLTGKGGFGLVYRVWDEIGKRFLACKVVCGAVMGEMLKREGAIQRHIDHPLFVRYVDILEHGDYVMLLMEYVEGENLAQRLKRGCLAREQAVVIAIQLAQGIGYLHERNQPILYRDLKPQNICLTGEGRVRLMDLGCACTISEARFSRAGTPGYAPWEQIGSNILQGEVPMGVLEKEKRIDAVSVLPGFYSDVYALGKLLYYMLTGDDPCKPPLQKPPIRAFDKKQSPLLEQVVMQCMEERPELRPPDMRCVLRMLRPLEADGIGGKIALRRKELVVMVKGAFAGRKENGFIYERNVCCQAVGETKKCQ